MIVMTDSEEDNSITRQGKLAKAPKVKVAELLE